MRILWLCNIMLPVIAEKLGFEQNNKEGWLSGLCDVIMSKQAENSVELAVAFPAGEQLRGEVECGKGILKYYGFPEDTTCPHVYDVGLEGHMKRITEDFKPDVIHCYGTEYPHTLAMCRACADKSKILISIQGLCSVYTNAYYADLPDEVIKSVTFRDFIKKDSLKRQRDKFKQRGDMEIEAVKLCGNVSGRTHWDKYYTTLWNPDVVYHHMNETLRENFYSGQWDEKKCIPHSIFLSQGDYPIKGLHYMLLALPKIKEIYPDVKVFVAGNSIVNHNSIKDKIKISAYGKYLLKLIERYDLKDNIEFLGKLSAAAMKEWYLKCYTFVCCSSIENSPNSLGEAMLLGMPCVTADVGGIESIFTRDRDGIVYKGFREMQENLWGNAEELAKAVIKLWNDPEKMQEFCKSAREHAKNTHNREENYKRLIEIYLNISRGN